MSAIEDLKKKTDGMPNEVVITLTAQQAKALLDQLEAERKRADDAHKYGSERDAENESLMLTVGRLRVEIAELKGDQVPVAWQWERATTHWECNGKYGGWELVRGSSRPKDHASRRNIQPLFTAPQKPVVLHDHANSDLVFSYKCPGCGSRPVIKHAGDCTHYHVETVEESEPAGGIVKDGE